LTSGQLLGAHEILNYYRLCELHLLSPDGHVLACILNTSAATPHLGLTLWDVVTGKVILQKDETFDLTPTNDNYSWLVTNKLHWPLVRWAFTPDGKRLMVNREPTTLIYDLDQQRFLKAGGALSQLKRKPFALVGNDRIVINNWDDPQKSALYSFPDGKELKQVAMGSQELHSVTLGDYVALTPMKDAALGLLDLATGQVPFTMPNNVLDIYDKTVLMESAEGGVAVTSQGLVPGAKGSEIIDLPLSDLGNLSAGAISADGKYLAVSNKNRSAIWNTETGERLFFMRPFSAGYFDKSDQFYGNFPRYRSEAHLQAVLDPQTRKTSKLSYPVADRAEQKGNVLLEFKDVDSSGRIQNSGDFEVRDVKTNQVLWTRHSLKEAPNVTPGAANELVISYDVLYESPGSDELKPHPELMAEQKALKDVRHGFLVEVVDRNSGAYLRGVVAYTQHSAFYVGRTAPLRTTAFGDFALIQDMQNSTLVYRFSTGARLGEVFGDMVAVDADSGLFCVINRDNDLVIYDAATVRERKHFSFSAPVRVAAILRARKQLMVVTADQKVHAISMDELGMAGKNDHFPLDTRN
jgi:WD40 repeat protein